MPKRRKFTRNDAYALLKELPYFDEIDSRIKANISVKEVARWIQEDRGGRLDVTREGLEKQLFRYKRNLLPGEVAEKQPMFFQKQIEKLERGVDEIEELEKLYLLQLHRMDRCIKAEDAADELSGSTRPEIRLAVDILSKMVEKKAQLGLIEHEPKKISFTRGTGILALDGDEEGEGVDEDLQMRLGLAAGKLLDVLEVYRAAEEEDPK